MTWLFVVLAVVVIAGAFLAMLGLLGELPETEPDLRPDRFAGEPEFDVVVRGYRMDEVELEVSRMQQEIDRLQASVTPAPVPDPLP